MIDVMQQVVKQEETMKKQKQRPIIIINPAEASKNGSLIPPLGLALMVSMLKSAGYESKVLDLTFDPDFAPVKSLAETDGIYFITFTTTLVDRVAEIIRIIRATDRDAFIMGGGAHPSARKEKVFDDVDIDAIGIGEVDITAVVDALHSSDWSGRFSNIKGIIYRHRGKVYVNGPVDKWTELDDLPMPDFSPFPIGQYFAMQGFRAISISTSRGCPYRCTYCQPILLNLFGPKVRYASPKRVADEIEHLTRTHKLDFFIISDDTFAFHQDRAKEICEELIRRKVPILWRCQSRVGLRKDVLAAMKKAGCFCIAFGVESGSQKILDSVHKDATVEMAKETFRYCKDVGILTHAFLMIGNVGETRETVQETINLARDIKPTFFNISIATPYPGTYLYEYAKKEGIIMDSVWDRYDHILSGSVAKLSEFEVEELPKLKTELEKAISNSQEKAKDLMRLVLDPIFIRNFLRVLWHNPTMPLRMASLVYRAIVKKGAGYRISNPLTKA